MMAQKIKSYFELGRVSNLPTCLSNVLAGFFLAGATDLSLAFFVVLFAVCCFYEAGMFSNDLFDYQFDIQYNPHRPLPQKKLSLNEALMGTILLFCVGLMSLILWAPKTLAFAILLIAFILTYNKVHKYFAAAPFLIGSCRACVYLIAATATGWSFQIDKVFLMSLVLMAYIVTVSFVARYEYITKLPQGLHVGKLLAGISLLDALVLFSIGHVMASIFCVGCFILTQTLHQKIKGT